MPAEFDDELLTCSVGTFVCERYDTTPTTDFDKKFTLYYDAVPAMFVGSKMTQNHFLTELK